MVQFPKSACINGTSAAFDFSSDRYSRFECKFPVQRALDVPSQKARLLVAFWGSVNKKNLEAVKEGRAEILNDIMGPQNGYAVGWVASGMPTEKGKERLHSLYKWIHNTVNKWPAIKEEETLSVKVAKGLRNLEAFKRFERKLLDPKSNFTVVRYLRSGSYGLTMAQKDGLENPANDAFAGIFKAKILLGKDFLGMLEKLIPAISFVAKGLRIQELKEALAQDDEQLAILKDVEPQQLVDEASMLEVELAELDEFEGKEDTDLIDVTAIRNKIRGMHETKNYRGERDETFHEIFVLLHRIYMNDLQAFDRLADILSEVTFKFRLRDIKGYAMKADWMKMPSYQERNMRGADGQDLYRDTTDRPDLFQPKDDDGMFYESPEDWAKTNSAMWQSWINELDNYEEVCSILKQGEESYTDQPQYSITRKIVEEIVPWRSETRLNRMPYIDYVNGQLFNRVSVFIMDAKEELRYREEEGKMKIAGLQEEARTLYQQVDKALDQTMASDNNQMTGHLLDLIEGLQEVINKAV